MDLGMLKHKQKSVEREAARFFYVFLAMLILTAVAAVVAAFFVGR